MKPHNIFLISLVFIIIAIGLILPNGLRAAVGNNAWSIAFVRERASANTPEQLLSPPAAHRHARVLLARSALAKDDTEQALSFIYPLAESPDRLALDMAANALYQQADYENAFDIWKALNHEAKLYAASRELTGKELHQPALFANQRLHELNPEKFTANFASSLRRQNEIGSAISILQNAIIDYPQSDFRVHWFRYLGDYLRAQGHYAQAENAYQLGLMEFPEDSRTWRNFDAMCSSHRNNREAGVVCYQRLIGMNPTDAEIFSSAGGAFEAFGLFDLAKHAFQSALEIDPQNQAAAQGLERLSGSD